MRALADRLELGATPSVPGCQLQAADGHCSRYMRAPTTSSTVTDTPRLRSQAHVRRRPAWTRYATPSDPVSALAIGARAGPRQLPRPPRLPRIPGDSAPFECTQRMSGLHHSDDSACQRRSTLRRPESGAHSSERLSRDQAQFALDLMVQLHGPP
jgi:hypothetical protein